MVCITWYPEVYWVLNNPSLIGVDSQRDKTPSIVDFLGLKPEKLTYGKRHWTDWTRPTWFKRTFNYCFSTYAYERPAQQAHYNKSQLSITSPYMRTRLTSQNSYLITYQSRRDSTSETRSRRRWKRRDRWSSHPSTRYSSCSCQCITFPACPPQRTTSTSSTSFNKWADIFHVEIVLLRLNVALIVTNLVDAWCLLLLRGSNTN